MNARRRNRRSGCWGCLVNGLSAFILLAAVVAVAGLGLLIFAPGLLPSGQWISGFYEVSVEDVDLSGELSEGAPTIAIAVQLPSATSTPEPPLLRPTWTPIPTQPSSTPAPLNTLPPTVTPSPLPTFPTKTPTPTPTPTDTSTPTITPTGPTPTPSPTRSSFLFTKTDNSPFYLQNQANSAGCRWLGIAGEVLNLDRNPVAAGSYRVHVWGSGIDERPVVGGAPAYGPSGWEQFVFDSPVMRDYNVQLETANGTAVSQVYQVQTRANCDENLLQIDFVQNH